MFVVQLKHHKRRKIGLIALMLAAVLNMIGQFDELVEGHWFAIALYFLSFLLFAFIIRSCILQFGEIRPNSLVLNDRLQPRKLQFSEIQNIEYIVGDYKISTAEKTYRISPKSLTENSRERFKAMAADLGFEVK